MSDIQFLNSCVTGLSASAIGSAQASKVIFVSEEFPGSSAEFRDALRDEISKAGFVVRETGGDELSGILAGEAGPGTVLVLPNATCFPAESKSALDEFLKRGNHLVAVSGPAFENMVVKVNGAWLTREELKLETTKADSIPALDFADADLSNWQHVSDSTGKADYGVEDPGSPDVPTALHVLTGEFSEADKLKSTPIADPFPEGYSTTVFWAKGGPDTHELIVEWTEKDRMCWMGVVKLTTEWKRYVLTPIDLRPWNEAFLPDRGGADDHFNPSNAERISFGLNSMFTTCAKGARQEYWVSDIRAGKDPYAGIDFRPPVLESISPPYKTYVVKAEGAQSDASDESDRSDTSDIVCPIPRMRGIGSDGLRKWRFIPGGLVNVFDTVPQGISQHMFLNTATEYASSVWGYTGWPQTCLDRSPAETAAGIVGVLEHTKRGVFIANAGTDHFAYESGEPTTPGAYLVNLTDEPVQVDVRFRIRRGAKPIHEEQVSAPIPARNVADPLLVKAEPLLLEAGEYRIHVTIHVNDTTVGGTYHWFQVIEYKELEPDQIVTHRDGDFRLGGKKWYPLGMNYWPGYAVAAEEGGDWLPWLLPQNYDPDLIEAELAMAEKLKMNVFSIAYSSVEQSRPLMDFLARAERHGIKVHLYLSTTHPLNHNLDDAGAMIEAAHLAQSPAVFSYDLGWEVHVGDYEARSEFDDRWQQWVIDRYGGVESAEKDWGYQAERVDGTIAGPTTELLTTDGEWRIYVAAYRRFWDDEISKGYRTVRRAIETIDPHHLMGARSGWAGTGSMWAVFGFPFDLASGAKHLDYTSPEAYNVGGDRLGFLKGGLNTAYGRFVSGGKPVFWAEFAPAIAVGLSPWTFEGYTAKMLQQQADYYRNMIEMTYETHANGSAGWWWPGGFRLGENSDLGAINPDGTPRPSALEIGKAADRFYTPRDIPEPDTFLTIDRDKYVTGYAGIYEEFCAQYAQATAEGKVVGIRTEGSGTDSANTPLIAVGGVPCTGQNPPKYLNAEFNWVKVNGEIVANSSTVEVEEGTPVRVAASIGNIAEATWLSPSHADMGRVYLVAERDGDRAVAPIDEDTPFLGDAEVSMTLADRAAGETIYTLRMTAKDRSDFGEVFRVTVRTR